MSGNKVYLAGPYVSRETLIGYAAELTRIGYDVGTRWIDGTHEVGTPGAAADAPLADRQRWAHDDLEDIRRCDQLVVFTSASVLPASEQHHGKSGGRHVETGFALALRKRVILVGEPENVFHWLPGVKAVPDWHEALIELASLLNPRPGAFERVGGAW